VPFFAGKKGRKKKYLLKKMIFVKKIKGV